MQEKSLKVLGSTFLMAISAFLFVFAGIALYHPLQAETKGDKNIYIEALRNEQMLEDIANLSAPEMEGRRAGTKGETLAADYIAAAFSGLQLKPAGDAGTYYQGFEIIPGHLINAHDTRFGRQRVSFIPGVSSAKKNISENLLALMPGVGADNEVIIISAHYDHLGLNSGRIFPGANDNASGVAVMLETARRLKAMGKPPRKTVIFAAWGAEEMGLLGSKHYVNNSIVPLLNTAMVINLDSIGAGSGNDFELWYGTSNMELKDIKEIAKTSGIQIYPVLQERIRGSDHAVFAEQGVAAFTLVSNQWEKDNHTSNDTTTYINSFRLQGSADFVTNLAIRLAW